MCGDACWSWSAADDRKQEIGRQTQMFESMHELSREAAMAALLVLPCTPCFSQQPASLPSRHCKAVMLVWQMPPPEQLPTGCKSARKDLLALTPLQDRHIGVADSYNSYQLLATAQGAQQLVVPATLAKPNLFSHTSTRHPMGKLRKQSASLCTSYALLC
mmetsp:Transcript_22584/g.62386  ORF Transcript_22584/g.62386 Transcript_22584/m.62386 type:complete len:160 (+) Transcript_22584:514-993(+)|eukprot:1160093-Pelagomonas_calceolata.AAC.2